MNNSNTTKAVLVLEGKRAARPVNKSCDLSLPFKKLLWFEMKTAINHALHKQYTLSTIPLDSGRMERDVYTVRSPDPFSLLHVAGVVRQTS